MKRYPHGAAGRVLLHERAPTPRPAWIETCRIDHGHGNLIELLRWCRIGRPAGGDPIRLPSISNQWYARATTWSPRHLHFDLDPRRRRHVRSRPRTARVVHEALDTLKMPSVVKTTGSERAAHLCADRGGPLQKQVWTFAKALAQELAVVIPRSSRPSTAWPVVRRGRVAGGLQPEPVGQARSRPSIRRARVRTPPSRRRSPGRKSTRGVRIRGLHVKNVRLAWPGLATCGNRCSASAGASSGRSTCR